MNEPSNQKLLISKGWIQAVALVMLFGFFTMGLLAYYTYTDEPPIPAQVVDANGKVLFMGTVDMGIVSRLPFSHSPGCRVVKDVQSGHWLHSLVANCLPSGNNRLVYCRDDTFSEDFILGYHYTDFTRSR